MLNRNIKPGEARITRSGAIRIALRVEAGWLLWRTPGGTTGTNTFRAWRRLRILPDFKD